MYSNKKYLEASRSSSYKACLWLDSVIFFKFIFYEDIY